MTDSAQAIEIVNLHKKFGPLEVLKGVSLSAKQGDVIAIIGGSGSGKSTFLRCINLLEQPSAGTITIHGETIEMKSDGRGGMTPANRKQVQRIRTQLGMVFQSFNLWQHMTVFQNVIEVPVHVLGVPKDKAASMAETILRRVGLYEKRDIYPAFLSGGQQQMVAIGRALMSNPEVLLCDEISLGLAPVVVRDIYAAFPRIRETGAAIVIVEQDIVQALKVANRVYCMMEGRITLSGKSGELDRATIHKAYFGEDGHELV